MSEAAPPVELERPGFASRRADPLAREPLEASPQPSPPELEPDHPEPSGSRPAGSTSASPGSPRPIIQAELAAAVAGALIIGVAVAGWLVRRPGRRLRRPLQADYKAVADPLARIVTRHVPVDLAPAVALSIHDACQATAAAMAYAERGPLLEPERNPEPPPGPGGEEAIL